MLNSLKRNNNTTLTTSLLSRGITTGRRLTQGHSPGAEQGKKMLDITANHLGALGVVRMNREHRYNTLTPNFVKQVKRGVETMYLDHGVKLIYLTTAQGQHFSNGTDFRTIMHYRANNEADKLTQYLGSIFELQASFAKCNKPIMTVAPGHSFNSGASLVAASGFPAMVHNSVMGFNEVQFGFVPHAGSSYYTSRLPGDFGTFLTLTGMPFTGKDAIRLKLADTQIDEPLEHELEMQNIVYALDPSSIVVGTKNNRCRLIQGLF